MIYTTNVDAVVSETDFVECWVIDLNTGGVLATFCVEEVEITPCASMHTPQNKAAPHSLAIP